MTISLICKDFCDSNLSAGGHKFVGEDFLGLICHNFWKVLRVLEVLVETIMSFVVDEINEMLKLEG